MDFSIPEPVWQGQDAYIIGGGPSLTDFEWDLLKNLNTIGCNDAYMLGKAFCKICVFGDSKWYYKHLNSLAGYDGKVYGAEPALNGKMPDWIQPLRRFAKGLHTDGVGWNGNTGMVALNLAILLGASRIYLLGFDMKRTKERSNWHENNLDKNPDSVYKKFLDWSKYVKQDWDSKFSHIEIFNITDDSDLDIFPKISVENFWSRRATG